MIQILIGNLIGIQSLEQVIEGGARGVAKIEGSRLYYVKYNGE